MNETVKQDILAILVKLLKILETKEAKDAYEIEELSNHTIHDASIFQDDDSISMAVISYSIYKMVTRGLDEREYRLMEQELKRMQAHLEKNEVDQYNEHKGHLLKIISYIDSRFGLYVSKVLNQAHIKKGTNIYSHGISLAQTAAILGVSQWELMSYIGKTNLVEYSQHGVNATKRMKLARSLFK